MRAIIVIFSLLIIFMISMNILVSGINEKRDRVKTKIERWHLNKGYLELKLTFLTKEPLFFSNDMNCKIYNKDKKMIFSLDKKIEVELKKNKTKSFIIGKVPKEIRYIDCIFIKD